MSTEIPPRKGLIEQITLLNAELDSITLIASYQQQQPFQETDAEGMEVLPHYLLKHPFQHFGIIIYVQVLLLQLLILAKQSIKRYLLTFQQLTHFKGRQSGYLVNG